MTLARLPAMNRVGSTQSQHGPLVQTDPKEEDVPNGIAIGKLQANYLAVEGRSNENKMSHRANSERRS